MKCYILSHKTSDFGILYWRLSAGIEIVENRKGRQLSFEDIQHYQKIIVALAETDRLMKEIDGIEFE